MEYCRLAKAEPHLVSQGRGGRGTFRVFSWAVRTVADTFEYREAVGQDLVTAFVLGGVAEGQLQYVSLAP